MVLSDSVILPPFSVDVNSESFVSMFYNFVRTEVRLLQSLAYCILSYKDVGAVRGVSVMKGFCHAWWWVGVACSSFIVSFSLVTRATRTMVLLPLLRKISAGRLKVVPYIYSVALQWRSFLSAMQSFTNTIGSEFVHLCWIDWNFRTTVPLISDGIVLSNHLQWDGGQLFKFIWFWANVLTLPKMGFKLSCLIGCNNEGNSKSCNPCIIDRLDSGICYQKCFWTVCEMVHTGEQVCETIWRWQKSHIIKMDMIEPSVRYIVKVENGVTVTLYLQSLTL